MQERELNRATIGVVSSTDISGPAAADEIKRGLQTVFGASSVHPFWDT